MTETYKRTQGSRKKGQHKEFIRYHWMRRTDLEPPNPSGLCRCGCNRVTKRASRTISERGIIKGEYLPFCDGHAGGAATRRQKITPDLWAVTDCGYESPCWVWKGSRKSQWGHCSVWISGREYSAHRTVYEQFVDTIPDGLELDHLCKNPPCVRPEHLEPVTHAENIRRSPVAKLTHEDVLRIRASTENVEILARQFGVAEGTIYSIRSRSSWRDL